MKRSAERQKSEVAVNRNILRGVAAPAYLQDLTSLQAEFVRPWRFP